MVDEAAGVIGFLLLTAGLMMLTAGFLWLLKRIFG